MSASDSQRLDPVQFVQSGARLLIDTNVFMETRPAYVGGLKPLFERCGDAILQNANPIVVPTKVQDELRKNAAVLVKTKPEEAAKAANALIFIRSADERGLVQKGLGDDSNPYADDLFVSLFEQFAPKYEMCVLTSDITLKIRIRLLALKSGRRLVAGHLTKHGDIEVENDQLLYVKGAAKVAKREGGAREMAVLEPRLEELRQVVGLPRKTGLQGGADKIRGTSARKPVLTVEPFLKKHKIEGPDSTLPVSSLPEEGGSATWVSSKSSGVFTLGPHLGTGGEGRVYAYKGKPGEVVKIFDKDHLTRHREAKIDLLVQRNIGVKGICAPTAVVRNRDGQFVGYLMPRAAGQELQRTIFNPRKLRKAFPKWQKADLVDVAISFLEQVSYLHSLNILLGDINPKNLMVDDKKNVYVIDADSWQIEGYPCPVGTPMFTSPSMLGKTYADDLRTMEDELFAVATMLFMILITGQFPYMRKGSDGDMVALIKQGYFAFQYEARNNRDQPEGDWKYKWSHVHKPVKDLFFDTFDKEDGKRYSKRPTTEEWLVVFRAYRQFLQSPLNSDPMSNDIYPIRHKAFRRDTPIKDCPTCGGKSAIAGFLRDGATEYSVPPVCNRCKGRQAPQAVRPGQAARPAQAIRSASSGTLTTVPCKDCRRSFPKRELTYGRCPVCTQKANTLDPLRLCVDCKKPFINFDHISWFTSKSLDIPKSHEAIKQICPPSTQPRAQGGGWARFRKWLTGY